MRSIWKYDLNSIVNDVAMPKGATVRHVDRKGGRADVFASLWVEVDTDAPLEGRTFVIAGTGQQLHAGTYVGTVLDGSLELVWHVFEVNA